MCNTPRYSESGACLGVQRCEEYEAMKQELDALRRAMDLLGVPAQATKDPDKAAPLRITVEIAKRAMGVVDGK